MKKITLLIVALLFTIVGYSQFPTPGSEGFEGTTGADLPTPVSYTHLDVYKRQMYGEACSAVPLYKKK